MFALWHWWRRLGGWRAMLADILLAGRLAFDRRVPLTAKFILMAAGLYFVSPINLSFEWIPFLGQLDDLAIALFAIGRFLKACPRHLVAEHASGLEREFTTGGRWGRIGEVARPSFARWTQR
jgi:uncharacterized membrane protein YkvA (DUF1232 family)